MRIERPPVLNIGLRWTNQAVKLITPRSSKKANRRGQRSPRALNLSVVSLTKRTWKPISMANCGRWSNHCCCRSHIGLRTLGASHRMIALPSQTTCRAAIRHSRGRCRPSKWATAGAWVAGADTRL